MPKISVIHYKKLIKFFEHHGFVFDRQKGSHLAYIKDGVKRPVVIPSYKEVPVFVIKENLTTAGISRYDYLKFFKIS